MLRLEKSDTTELHPGGKRRLYPYRDVKPIVVTVKECDGEHTFMHHYKSQKMLQSIRDTRSKIPQMFIHVHNDMITSIHNTAKTEPPKTCALKLLWSLI